jgi:hypothetical protein
MYSEDRLAQLKELIKNKEVVKFEQTLESFPEVRDIALENITELIKDALMAYDNDSDTDIIAFLLIEAGKTPRRETLSIVSFFLDRVQSNPIFSFFGMSRACELSYWNRLYLIKIAVQFDDTHLVQRLLSNDKDYHGFLYDHVRSHLFKFLETVVEHDHLNVIKALYEARCRVFPDIYVFEHAIKLEKVNIAQYFAQNPTFLHESIEDNNWVRTQISEMENSIENKNDLTHLKTCV